MYADNTHKFVVVLNARHALPQLLNAATHLAAALVAVDGDAGAMEFLPYTDGDGARCAMLSRWPFIILVAEHTGQLRELRAAAVDAGLAPACFAATMIGGSAAEQRARTRETPGAALELLAVGLYGPAEVLGPLTRRFSLFRYRHARPEPGPAPSSGPGQGGVPRVGPAGAAEPADPPGG